MPWGAVEGHVWRWGGVLGRVGGQTRKVVIIAQFAFEHPLPYPQWRTVPSVALARAAF